MSSLKKLNEKQESLTTPGGTPGKIQAPGVSWNEPFKASIVESFDDWLMEQDHSPWKVMRVQYVKQF